MPGQNLLKLGKEAILIKMIKHFLHTFSLIVLGLLINSKISAQHPAKIIGRVVDENFKPVENTNVFLDGTEYSTITNTDGTFEINVPSSKRICIKVSHVNFFSKKKCLTLTPGEVHRMQFNFKTPILDVLEVDYKDPGTSTIQKINSIDAASISIPSSNIENLLPALGYGVKQNNELSSGYNVRGGNFDENLIYVNDIQVYRPFLARSGQQEGLSFINPSMIKNINFSAGGFDAKYGDKLSSVLDIEYAEANNFSANFVSSLLGAQIHVQDRPSARFNYNTGLRYRTNSYLLGALDTKGDYKPLFVDYQGMFSYYLNENWKASFFGTYSINKYRVVPENRETNWGSINEALRFTVHYEGQEITQFETYMGAFSFTNEVNENLNLKFISSIYQTHENEYFDLLGEYRLDELERDLGNDNYGNIAYNRGVGAFLNHARNSIDATVINAYHKGTFSKNSSKLSWGAKIQHEIIKDKMIEWNYTDSSRFSLPHPNDSIGYADTSVIPYQYLTMSNSLKANNFMESDRITAYVQKQYRFSKVKNINIKDTIYEDDKLYLLDTAFIGYRFFSFTIGGRTNYWTYNNQLFFTPRVSFKLKPAIYEIKNNKIHRKDFIIKFATGLYYQPPFYRAVRNLQGELNPSIRAQKSIHLVLGSEYVFDKWNRPFKIGSEIYYKYLTDIIPYKIENVRTRYFGENNAKGYARGIDLKLNGEFVPGIESYASISFLQTKEDILDDYYYDYYNSDGENIIFGYTENDVITDSTKQEPGYIPRPTDQRISFALFFQDQMPNDWDTEKIKWSTMKVNLNLIFGTRLPYGPPGYVRYTDTLRSSLYRRLDIGFTKEIISSETDRTKFKEKSFLYNISRMWISFEVFNLLDISNTINYNWIRDVSGRKYSIPSYLTSRRLNVKLAINF